MHFRSIFLSDIHLGSPDCQADRLLDFLQHMTCDELYLVGDVIDFWVLRKSGRTHWPDAHTQVLSRFLALPRSGTRVRYIPGNHDELVRRVYGSLVSGIEIVDELVYTTAAGQRLLVLHGDMFDEIVLTGGWQHRLGADLYDGLMKVSRRLNAVRKLLGCTHWSLAGWLKYQFADAVQHISDYEYAAAREAASRFLDGIICGHIHHPRVADIEGIRYLNCGDWVEHATALAETDSGRIMQIDWAADRDRLLALSQQASRTRKQERQALERAA